MHSRTLICTMVQINNKGCMKVTSIILTCTSIIHAALVFFVCPVSFACIHWRLLLYIIMCSQAEYTKDTQVANHVPNMISYITFIVNLMTSVGIMIAEKNIEVENQSLACTPSFTYVYIGTRVFPKEYRKIAMSNRIFVE